MDCYNCIHCGTIPGSAHKSCDALKTIDDTGLLDMFFIRGMVELNNKSTGKPMITFDQHGIDNGWCTWPIDFDPIWIESCDFFTVEQIPFT